MRRLPLTLALLLAAAAACSAASSALFTDLKPIVLDASYRHDRFDTKPKDIVRHFRAYTTSFDSDDDNDGDGTGDNWAIPEWVAYELRKAPPNQGSAPARPSTWITVAYELRKAPPNLGSAPDRPSTWITDTTLHTQQVAPDDDSYKNSGYSRGHMCMKTHAWRLGADADWNTHTVLNACPQIQRMNNGAWKGLEQKTGKWADKFEVVWIVCGPIIFNNGTPTTWIGDPGEVKVAVPDAFFKIVVKDALNGGLDVLAFILPMYGGDDYGSSKADLTPYLSSVDAIEALTGLDFLSNVNEEMETKVERIVQTELWETGG